MTTHTTPAAPELDPLESLRSKSKRRSAPKKENDGAPLAPVRPIAVPADEPRPTPAQDDPSADPSRAPSAATAAPAEARTVVPPIAPPRAAAQSVASSETPDVGPEWRARIRALDINPDLARIDTTQSYRREIALRTQDIVQRLREETGDIVKRTELVELAIMMLPDDMDEVSDALRELRKRGMRPGPGPAPQRLE